MQIMMGSRKIYSFGFIPWEALSKRDVMGDSPLVGDCQDTSVYVNGFPKLIKIGGIFVLKPVFSSKCKWYYSLSTKLCCKSIELVLTL
jgi:hypothetical protein